MIRTILLLLVILFVAPAIARAGDAAGQALTSDVVGIGQCAPAGGWFPYGGGLLTWWSNHCFPHCGAPDDYCRKPLPCTCWPPYTADYTWASSEPWTANCGCEKRGD